MPQRENKTRRDVDPTHRSGETKHNALLGKLRQRTVYRAGHDTRINAFVTSLGRRNQAKRDAR
jgi:hypothetical protein